MWNGIPDHTLASKCYSTAHGREKTTWESLFRIHIWTDRSILWSHSCCSHLHHCTVTTQLFWIASVLNPPISWMKQIQGAKQKRKSSLVCQILVYAKDLHADIGPKYLSERLEAQVYWVSVTTPNLPGFSQQMRQIWYRTKSNYKQTITNQHLPEAALPSQPYQEIKAPSWYSMIFKHLS